jgi:acyl dehydratase
MISIDTLSELSSYVGQEIGCTDWVTVDQDLIDRFADVTGDRNWYHVDTARAARELPGGLTIAHGLMTLSLVPGLVSQILEVRRHGRAFNYGLDKVRFPSPVPVGGRLRMRMTVLAAERTENGTMLKRRYTMELEGAEKPAMVADMLTLVID